MLVLLSLEDNVAGFYIRILNTSPNKLLYMQPSLTQQLYPHKMGMVVIPALSFTYPPLGGGVKVASGLPGIHRLHDKTHLQ